ncbi:hypothetical protein HHK36_008408 [Tetracentron sinense]|uniref:Thioredoxin domain-containing protein n=1 Tax=Tetracentron sinense TaxID=13715 RepID=A0A835DN55_TETSI|nr:hypothetical protein HHK36_008408 [Tetracentron sinense]
MQRQNILYHRSSFNFARIPDGQLDSGVVCVVPSLLPDRSHVRLWLLRAKIPYTMKNALDSPNISSTFRPAEIKGLSYETTQGELSDEDDDLCPVECVREFKNDEEFFRILEKSKETGSLVVVDFFRTSCGSCKYIEQGFRKLCKGSGDREAAVIFLKHNPGCLKAVLMDLGSAGIASAEYKYFGLCFTIPDYWDRVTIADLGGRHGAVDIILEAGSGKASDGWAEEMVVASCASLAACDVTDPSLESTLNMGDGAGDGVSAVPISHSLKVVTSVVSTVEENKLRMVVGLDTASDVIDEYDEQSEVAERLRIKLRSMDFHGSKTFLQGNPMNLDMSFRRFPSSTSIKMGSCWKHFQPGTKRGLSLPFLNIHLLLLKTFKSIGLYF